MELRSLLLISIDGLLDPSSISPEKDSPAISSAAGASFPEMLSVVCEVFCSGWGFLLGGRPLPLFATGGTISSSDSAISDMSIYDPFVGREGTGTSTTMEELALARVTDAEGATFCRLGRGIVSGVLLS